MATTRAAVFEPGAGSPSNGAINQFEENAQKSLDNLNPFSDNNTANKGNIPFYVTGARALIKVGGKAIGVAQRCRWNITYNSTPISTIDAAHPWDIDVGQASISCELSQVMNPTKGPEHDGIFHIMKAAVHQPMVELQIVDRSFGTQMLYARGMFTQLTGSVGVGQVGGWSSRFVGVAFQHYVSQQFQPYSGIAGAASSLIDGLQDISSEATGGLL